MKQTIKKTLSMFLRTLLIIFTVTGCGSENDAAFSDNETESGRKTITVNGTDYFPRQDITVVLLMGIDTTGEMVDSGSYNNDGESDVVALLVFNEESETFSVININRDAMVNMPVLGLAAKKQAQPTSSLPWHIPMAPVWKTAVKTQKKLCLHLLTTCI